MSEGIVVVICVITHCSVITLFIKTSPQCETIMLCEVLFCDALYSDICKRMILHYLENCSTLYVSFLKRVLKGRKRKKITPIFNYEIHKSTF